LLRLPLSRSTLFPYTTLFRSSSTRSSSWRPSFRLPRPSFSLPLPWSTLPPSSVDLSPPSLPTSSLTLPLPWSHLPSILSSIRIASFGIERRCRQKGAQDRCHWSLAVIGRRTAL